MADGENIGQGGLSERQILAVIGGLALGMLLAALDQTIVATAMRTIADDLNGLSLQAWVTTAFLITSTVTMPLYGKLSDLYGRKPFYLAAISIFLAGSALCTLADSMYALAAFRALQGIGAGGLMSLAFAILADIVAPRERAKYQGYFAAVFGTASVAGPLVGGFFAGANQIFGIAGWRWVFLVNVPIGLVALVVVARALNIPHTRQEHRVDWLGAVLLAVGIVPLLIVAEQGRNWGFGSVPAIVCYLIGAAGVGCWVLVESRMGDDALIPLRLFRAPMFSRISVVTVLFGMAMFGGMTTIPLYFQIVRGMTPTEAGLMMLPLSVGMAITSIGTGRATARTGHYRRFFVAGAAVIAVAMLLLWLEVSPTRSITVLAVIMFLLGLGLGSAMQPLSLAMQAAAPARDMGVATSSSTFMRQMGGTFGVAVFVSVLFSTVSHNIKREVDTAMTEPAFQQALRGHSGPLPAAGSVNDSSFMQTIDPVLAAPFEAGFADSMRLVFLLAAVVAALAFLAALAVRELPLRTVSGIEARALEG